MNSFYSIILFLTFVLLPPPTTANPSCDVSVIGAGIGGVYTAWRLSVDTNTVAPNRVCIYEAKARPGGRILTVRDPVPGFEGFTVDLGAYRFHTQIHRHTRLLANRLGFQLQCYTDTLSQFGSKCPSVPRLIINPRGLMYDLDADGTTAEDKFKSWFPELPYRIPAQFRWNETGPQTSPRTVNSFLIGPNSIVKELRERWTKLQTAPDYATGMDVADEIIAAMRGGKYRGIPYSEISSWQAARLEGITEEEISLQLETGSGAGGSPFLRANLDTAVANFVRGIALQKDNSTAIKAMALPVEMRSDSDIPRRKGMRSFLDVMLDQMKQKGVKVLYNSRVTSVTRVKKGSKQLQLTLSNGKKVTTNKLFMNIGKPDMIALGAESEPLKSSSQTFKDALARLYNIGSTKTYCFWEDAWWVTKLGITYGESATRSEHLTNTRYHDGNYICEDNANKTKCRGGYLVSYTAFDRTGVASGIHAREYNNQIYAPITGRDNLKRFIPGSMTPIEEKYMDDLVAQVRRVHGSSLEKRKMDVEKVIGKPAGCVQGDWLDVGIHQPMGPRSGANNLRELYAKPIEDLDIGLVNEAWGQIVGWAEGSLNSAERALLVHYKLKKPKWMDDPFFKSVIVQFNQGA